MTIFRDSVYFYSHSDALNVQRRWTDHADMDYQVEIEVPLTPYSRRSLIESLYKSLNEQDKDLVRSQLNWEAVSNG